MRASEIGLPLLEMSFDRKIVEQKFRAREETINEHLVKLFAFDVEERTRIVWKKEIRNHILYLSSLRIKSQKHIPAKTIMTWLYSDPFEGNEIAYVSSFVRMHDEDYARNQISVKDVGDHIRAFWNNVVPALSSGNPASEIVAAL